MIRFPVIRLYFPTVFADLKAFAHIFNAGYIQFFAYSIAFAKVNLTKRRFPNEFIAERKFFIVHPVCTCDVGVFINIHQQLLAVENVVTVLAFIVDQTLCVVHIGIHHLYFKHIPDLARVSPLRASATRAGSRMFSCLFYLCMRTRRAESPLCRLCCRKVDLINRQLPSIHIEAVVWCKLADGRGCRSTVLVDHLLVFSVSSCRCRCRSL